MKPSTRPPATWNIARKLRLNVRPGHVEYMSKADAAASIDRVITDLLRSKQ